MAYVLKLYYILLLTNKIKKGIHIEIGISKGGQVEKAVVTTKGQVVIPSKFRRRFGIKKGTQVFIYEKNGEIVVSQSQTSTLKAWQA